MSTPADPPQQQPPGTTSADKKARRWGALVATLVVVLFSLTALGFGSMGVFLAGPGVAFLGVVLGSVLTIFERTRQFAVGFLIASAVLIFVTAGVCVALIASLSSSFALGAA